MKIRDADAVGCVLQRLFHFLAYTHFVEHPLELGADRRPGLTRHHLYRLGCWESGPDGANDQIESIRENVEKSPLIPTLRDLE